ncbi:MAG: oligoendopeptidase F [Aerococcus sp.]|nr:oligoendopeptidase F [Aerococcus sp.]
MAIIPSFPKRSEVAVESTWDLTPLFKSVADFEAALTDVLKQAQAFKNHYEGQLETTETIQSAIHALADIYKLVSRISHYAFLPVEANRNDQAAILRLQEAKNTIQQVNKLTAFLRNTLLEADDHILDELVAADDRLADYVRQLKRDKKIYLGKDVEGALQEFAPVFGQPLEIYSQAKLADMTFPNFTVDGVEYPLSFVLYEDFYMYHPDTAVRRAAFDQFSKTLAQYQNAVAQAYYAHVMREKAEATLRGFDSVFDYLLFDQEVTREMYDRQIDVIMSDLAPVMQKYITHLKEENNLDEMTYADLKIDLDPEYSQPLSWQDAENYVREAASALGEDYVNTIGPAFKERWIDYAKNEGKSTGGFATMAGGVHPYILMNFNGQLSDVYTLIHELGHAGQMINAEQHNLYLTDEPSLYLVESQSTFNELLMAGYLKQTQEDDRTQRFARAQMLTNTYFHNFITHLLEAAYQREVYRLVDAGKGFTAATLSELTLKVFRDFWGDAVVLNPGSELTWMRQPHYYMGLYSYTYSAGLTIATQSYLNVANHKPGAVDDWLNYLKLGSCPVVDAAKVAGVDVTTAEPLANTIAYLDQTVDEIIAYSKTLAKTHSKVNAYVHAQTKAKETVKINQQQTNREEH